MKPDRRLTIFRFLIITLPLMFVFFVFAQEQQTVSPPKPPSTVLGPQLIAWSELQKPHPVQPSFNGPQTSQQGMQANGSAQQSESAAKSEAMVQSYEGVISDTRCGAKHAASIGKSAADCARACVHASEHFALVDGDTLYLLEGNVPAIKELAGQRVKIVGTQNGNTIIVSSVALADAAR
jgi:hypothetical protein